MKTGICLKFPDKEFKADFLHFMYFKELPDLHRKYIESIFISFRRTSGYEILNILRIFLIWMCFHCGAGQYLI